MLQYYDGKIEFAGPVYLLVAAALILASFFTARLISSLQEKQRQDLKGLEKGKQKQQKAFSS